MRDTRCTDMKLGNLTLRLQSLRLACAHNINEAGTMELFLWV